MGQTQSHAAKKLVSGVRSGRTEGEGPLRRSRPLRGAGLVRGDPTRPAGMRGCGGRAPRGPARSFSPCGAGAGSVRGTALGTRGPARRPLGSCSRTAAEDRGAARRPGGAEVNRS